jgi:hypothetical protein
MEAVGIGRRSSCRTLEVALHEEYRGVSWLGIRQMRLSKTSAHNVIGRRVGVSVDPVNPSAAWCCGSPEPDPQPRRGFPSLRMRDA